MKSLRMSLTVLAAAAVMLATSGPAHAQFGLPKGLKDKIGAVTERLKDVELTAEEEASLGADISAKVRALYGVVQDPEIHRYVTLVGRTLAGKAGRPEIAWKFIVLDTDGVNALAAPGGFVHVTRGALALMKSESELAGVLAHELLHVTRRHTVRAIQKNKVVQMGASQTSIKSDPALYQRLLDESTRLVMAGFGRAEELEADAEGLGLAEQAGYAPGGLKAFLTTLKERNSASTEKQGLFASHPEMDERLQKHDALVQGRTWTSGAVLADRFAAHVKYPPVALSEMTTVADGTMGFAEGKTTETAGKKEAAAPAPSRSRFSLGGLKNAIPSGGSSTKQSAAVTGSGGVRGVDKERSAKGGSNPAVVAVNLTPADLDMFIAEGALRK